ncbi:MAG: A/G-specific adenine glycosylase [Akkermansiaceae bacterium]|nr:A/G-specific adenine glycosylase [Akkermansiaceae bacterium]
MTHPASPIARALVDWFAHAGRSYPWRRTRDPWAILVSEVMLQQTTIPTVLARYEQWMQRFPTPAALAEASEEEALRSWEGLGYYRRVRSLQATARAIQREHGGHFPTSESALRALPGIGDYTVGALLSFAYNRPAPLVDANVARVFARLFNDTTPVDTPAGRRKHWEWAARLVHPTEPRAYNSALMELGQTLCTPGRPDCLLCPLREHCRAERPEELPVRRAKKELTRLEHHDVWCLRPEGLLMEKQAEGARHAGMYRLPRRSESEVQGLPLLCRQSYSITRYKVTRSLYEAPPGLTPREGECFLPLASLAAAPVASPDRKLLRRLLPEHESGAAGS